MTDATASPAPPATSAPSGKRGFGARSYVLAGCSVGGALCASLAANTDINYVFAIASAIFGGLIVLLTAAPAADPAPAVAASPAPATGSEPVAASDLPVAPVAAVPSPVGMNSVTIGVTAAIMSFIMNQVAQFGVGGSIGPLIPADLNQMQLLVVGDLIGTAVLIVKFPFDLVVGAYHVTRARNVLVALGVFALTYFLCYVIEQLFSALLGASGLINIAPHLTPAQLLSALAIVLLLPVAGQAIGALGAKGAAWLTRRGR